MTSHGDKLSHMKKLAKELVRRQTEYVQLSYPAGMAEGKAIQDMIRAGMLRAGDMKQRSKLLRAAEELHFEAPRPA